MIFDEEFMTELWSHWLVRCAVNETTDYENIYGIHPVDDVETMMTTSQGELSVSDAYYAYMQLKAPESFEEPSEKVYEGSEVEVFYVDYPASNAGRPARSDDGAANKRKTVRLTTSEYERSQQLLEEGESWSEMVRRLIRKQCALHDARTRLENRTTGE